MPDAEDIANLTLAQAAPDLLAALDECVRWLARAEAEGLFTDCHTPSDHAIPAARAAIAKARGQ